VRAKDWIERDGQLRLSQIDSAYLPFKFRIGDQVSTASGTAKGTIREGFYRRGSSGLGSYQIVYEVANGEGLFFKAKEPELKKEAEEG
jgi:hypothetical protein